MKRLIWTLSLLLQFTLLGCGSGVGGECRDDRECPRDGFCCESDRCGGGMCTYECDRDRDCPGGTECQSGICMRTCNSDRECDRHQECTRAGVCAY